MVCPAERRDKQIKEKELLTLIKDWLRLRGVFFFRVHQSLGSTPGLPDLVLIHKLNGRPVYLELKASKGRPSHYQIAFAQEAGKAGAIAIISSDFDYIVKILSEDTQPGYYCFMPETEHGRNCVQNKKEGRG